MRERKIEIVNDIIELTEYCYNNGLRHECADTLYNNGQHKYSSNNLFKRTLMNKTKLVLDKIRTELLKGIHEGF